MPDPLDAVNATALFYRELAIKPDTSPSNAKVWLERANELAAAAAELHRLRAWAKPIPAEYGDLSDLPPDLISQLSGIKTDELEDQVFAIVKAAGDQIELDRLLIELYRRFKTVHQRRFLMNKCYRMAQKGLIHLVAGKKGTYTAKPQSELDDPRDDDVPPFELGEPRPPSAYSSSAEDDDEFAF
jgi:hypothetical protein